MSLAFEDLEVLREAEGLADKIWKVVARWQAFERDSVGNQLVRAIDSVGANIAEAFGRYHYGEKLQFLYYARGSVFESKYWLNRVLSGQLASEADVQSYIADISKLARKLNAFTTITRSQRYKTNPSKIQETSPTYYIPQTIPDDFLERPDLFTIDDIEFLENLD